MSDEKKDPPPDLFPYDEMSTGVASALQRRALQVSGAPDQPVLDPTLKPMTGAQLAFRPSAPPRQPSGTTGTHAAFKPGAKPTTGTQPAFKPTTGTQPAFKPAVKPSTGTHSAYRPRDEADEEPPTFDPEKLQAQFRAMSLTDSALGHAGAKPARPSKTPQSAAEDTFVKTKMKEAESKVPDFNFDEDLG